MYVCGCGFTYVCMYVSVHACMYHMPCHTPAFKYYWVFCKIENENFKDDKTTKMRETLTPFPQDKTLF